MCRPFSSSVMVSKIFLARIFGLLTAHPHSGLLMCETCPSGCLHVDLRNGLGMRALFLPIRYHRRLCQGPLIIRFA